MFQHHFPADATPTAVPARFVICTTETLEAQGIPIPDNDALVQITQAALAAQVLFFAAAIREPSHEDLVAIFESFVIHCAVGTHPEGTE